MQNLPAEGAENVEDARAPLKRRIRNAAFPGVIPDCCNLGVMVRTLIAVNCLVFGAILLRTDRLADGLNAFVEVSFLLELSLLSCLLVLCALRPWLQDRAPWQQRLACALLPALVTAALMAGLATPQSAGAPRAPWSSTIPILTLVQGAGFAALAGAVMQHYFELRLRAFSPALAQARLAALQARIRPHFLFNSLNAVLALMRSAPRQAEGALEDLSDLFRVLLRDTGDMTSLAQEIHLCRQYLSLEKIRLGERLQVDWQLVNLTEENLARAKIPSLVVQPLVENAVHYGVEPVPHPVLVTIRVARSLERIEIVVVNPYHEGIVSSGTQMALANIGERLTLLFDVEAEMQTAVVDGRFEVRLRMPYLRDR
jgi:two-component system sensor histidine kinase AlgZ